jgi:hypothetical protein
MCALQLEAENSTQGLSQSTSNGDAVQALPMPLAGFGWLCPCRSYLRGKRLHAQDLAAMS